MSDISFEDYMNFSDEQWQQRITDIMRDDEHESTPEQRVNQDNEVFTNEHTAVPGTSDVPSTGLTTNEQQSTRDIDISYTIVKVRRDKDLKPPGTQFDFIRIGDPSRYAPNSQTDLAENAVVETLFPTDDEDDIKHWKLVPRSARVKCGNYWCSFWVKWLEYLDRPVEFIYAGAKDSYVTNCEVKCLADDDNKNTLLYVNMTVLSYGVPCNLEVWCKRNTGDERTQLTSDEAQYIWDEELKEDW